VQIAFECANLSVASLHRSAITESRTNFPDSVIAERWGTAKTTSVCAARDLLPRITFSAMKQQLRSLYKPLLPIAMKSSSIEMQRFKRIFDRSIVCHQRANIKISTTSKLKIQDSRSHTFRQATRPKMQQDDMQAAWDEEESCAVCMDSYSEERPRTALRCGHELCQPCIRIIRASRRLNFPLCRRHMDRPPPPRDDEVEFIRQVVPGQAYVRRGAQFRSGRWRRYWVSAAAEGTPNILYCGPTLFPIPREE